MTDHMLYVILDILVLFIIVHMFHIFSGVKYLQISSKFPYKMQIQTDRVGSLTFDSVCNFKTFLRLNF